MPKTMPAYISFVDFTAKILPIPFCLSCLHPNRVNFEIQMIFQNITWKFKVYAIDLKENTFYFWNFQVLLLSNRHFSKGNPNFLRCEHVHALLIIPIENYQFFYSRSSSFVLVLIISSFSTNMWPFAV